jgi:hypothetical protein
VDELRALLAAGVIKGISVGFMPTKAEPSANGGTHYLRQTLCEASLVAVPANPSSLLTAKALGVSQQTIKMVFKQSENLTIGQRIRKTRRSVRKAKLLKEKSDTPAKRRTFARVIALLEKEERELRNQLRLAPKETVQDRQIARARAIHARAKALVKKIDDRIAKEEEAASSFYREHQRQQAETRAAFTAQALKHQDLPKPTFESYTSTWQGQKLPPMTWRGKKI